MTKQFEYQWFAEWQTTHACDDFNTKVGHKSHKMGEDEALEQLNGVLTETYPSLEWNDVCSKYQEVYEAEAAEIRAQMVEDDEEEEDGDEKDVEAVNEAGQVDETAQVNEAAQGTENDRR